jgi:hypothetical protein
MVKHTDMDDTAVSDIAAARTERNRRYALKRCHELLNEARATGDHELLSAVQLELKNLETPHARRAS